MSVVTIPAMSTPQAALLTYIKVLADLHSRWEFHLPLVEAQFQFRERYYGLASAQLLEDLYLDALIVFIQQHKPEHVVIRPPRGIKEYDYEFDGERISHKVSKSGAIEIAVLWDATKKVKPWTSTKPIALECAFYPTKTIDVRIDDAEKTSKILTLSHHYTFREGDQAALVRWKDGELSVKKIWSLPSHGSIKENLRFDTVWKEFAALDHRNEPINEHEIIVFRPTKKLHLEEGHSLHLQSEVLRPGTYLFPTAMFHNVTLKKNNRAQLVPKNIVSEKMRECLKNGHFVPSTTWYSCFSASEPPNLFLTQRQELDARFKDIKLGFSTS